MPARLELKPPSPDGSYDLAAALANVESDVVVVIDVHGVFRFANAAAARTHGVAGPAALVGKHVSEVFAPADVTRLMAKVHAVATSGEAQSEDLAVDVADRRQSHRTRTVPLKGDDGSVDAVLVIAHDASDRMRADEALHLQSAIVRNMAEGACLVRASDTTIVYANPRFEGMFGYGPGEMNGLPVARLNYGADARTAESVAREIVADLERSGERLCELQNVRKDGTPFWCRAHTSASNHPTFGKVWVSVHQDITAQKQAEAEVRRLTTELVLSEERERRGLARDLHDGLTQLLVLLHLRLSKLAAVAAAPEVRDALHLVEQAEQTTRSLMYDLSPPLLYDLGLQPAVEWLAGQMSERYSLDVRVSGALPSGRGLGEPERVIVYRCLRELLVNAARHAGVDAVVVALSGDDEYVQISVSDRGAGFEPEGVGAKPGESFGLLSIRERLRQLGGELSIRSAPGAGTEVRLIVPLAAQAEELP